MTPATVAIVAHLYTLGQIRFGVCLMNSSAVHLQLHKIYILLPDIDAQDEDLVRVVDDTGGHDHRYPADWFADIDVPPAVRSSLLK